MVGQGRRVGHLGRGHGGGFFGVQGGEQVLVDVAGSINVSLALLQVGSCKVQQQAAWQHLHYHHYILPLVESSKSKADVKPSLACVATMRHDVGFTKINDCTHMDIRSAAEACIRFIVACVTHPEVMTAGEKKGRGVGGGGWSGGRWARGGGVGVRGLAALQGIPGELS